MNLNRYLLPGVLGILSGAVVWLFAENWLLGLLAGAAVFVLMWVVFRPRKTEMEAPASKGRAAMLQQVLAEGNQYLGAIWKVELRIHDPGIKDEAVAICKTAKKILDALGEQPENIPGVQRFFHYYLPTFQAILEKYERIERSGTMTDQRDKVEKHLKEIKSAMEKQHANHYEDDMLDLSVEMEVMTSSCKQDGLLTDADFVIQNGENKINLTL